MLKTDAPAPALRFPLVTGETFDLADETPEHFTLVIFYRGVHCPLCRKQIETDVAPNLGKLAEIGLGIVAVSMDEEARVRKQQDDGWAFGDLRVGYALPEETARAWGLYISTARAGSTEPDRFAEPGMSLIRPDGRVFAHWQQSVPFARPRIEDLIPGLEFVIGNGYPPRGTA
ncbi:MAG: peroxiredoxin-like family protein [Pseudomonadota bacterium]